jgi:hypothetical protein
MAKLFGIHWLARRFFLKTFCLVLLIRLGLWLAPFRKMRAWVDKLAQPAAGVVPTGWPSPQQIAWTVAAASHYIPQASCLTQALTTQIILGRYGHPATLRIGIARSDNGQIQAHAWIECNGQVVIGGAEENLQKYVTLPTFRKEES